MKIFICICFALLYAVLGNATASTLGPSISISSPANNSVVLVNSNVVVIANPQTTGTSPIVRVDFWHDNWAWFSAVGKAPFQATYANIPAGAHLIRVRATDASGAIADSNVTITAVANQPPTISITSPANNKVILPGASVTIAADAHDPNGDNTIAQVAFYDGTTLIGSATSAPYQVVYANVATGTHTIMAKATDTGGDTATSSITLTASPNRPPVVTIASPVANASVPMNTNLTISANVIDPDDAGGGNSIAEVDFYYDNFKWFGSTTKPPYTSSFSVPPGVHTILVRAMDTSNAQGQATVSVNANLPQLLPDLVVTTVNYSNGVFTAVVKNQGTLDIASNTTIPVSFYVDNTYLTYGSVSAPLPIGQSITIHSAALSTPVAYGNHSLKATADSADTIAELSKTNNSLSQNVTISAQPDLYIQSFVYSNGYFNANITNRGDASTPAGQAVTIDFYVDGILKASGSTTSQILAGKTVNIQTTGNPVTIPAGQHTMLAIVNGANTIAESNTLNNQLTSALGAPEAPMDVKAVAADSVASISFELDPNTTSDGWSSGKPGAANGSTITDFLVTASDGTTMHGTSSPIIMTGLKNGTSYTFTVTATNSMGSVVSAPSNSVIPDPVPAFVPDHATRPSGNTGHGLFVLNGKLYDANGVEFVIRGVNHNHWDASISGLYNSGANTERIVMDYSDDPLGSKAQGYTLSLLKAAIAHHIVPMPGNWKGTCQTDPSYLTAIVNEWVETASVYTPYNDQMIINIANEWGPANSVVWHDQYLAAIKSLRAAGYTSPISITSGGCGQDINDIAQYGQDLLEQDPQHNLIFDLHVYGGTNAGNLVSNFDTIKNSAPGLTVIVGEFGPGRNLDSTLITPGEVITAANEHGFGWMGWAWDDGAYNSTDKPVGNEDYGFQMSICMQGDFGYKSSADLTIFGRDVVENPVYGLKARAVPQTGF